MDSEEKGAQLKCEDNDHVDSADGKRWDSVERGSGMAVKIGSAIFKQELEEMKGLYELEFGEGSTAADPSSSRAVSREAYIERYASALAFWRWHLPELDPGKPPAPQVLARHAICTNAERNILREVGQRELREAVDTRSSALTQARRDS